MHNVTILINKSVSLDNNELLNENYSEHEDQTAAESREGGGRVDRQCCCPAGAGVRSQAEPSRGDQTGEPPGGSVGGRWRNLRCPPAGSGR